jgi:hypothetical protein
MRSFSLQLYKTLLHSMQLVKTNRKALILVFGLLTFIACNKSSLELPEAKPAPSTNSIDLLYQGSKIADLSLEGFDYRGSNKVRIRAINLESSQTDSLSTLLYFGRSNTSVFDSIVFLYGLRAIKRDSLKYNDTLLVVYNSALISNTKYAKAEILYRKDYNQEPFYSKIGVYNGYAAKTSSLTTYAQVKGYINAEGKLNLWLKDASGSSHIGGQFINDTLLVNVYALDRDNDPSQAFELDALSKNTYFTIQNGILTFQLKATDTSAELKSLKFNLSKTY